MKAQAASKILLIALVQLSFWLSPPFARAFDIFPEFHALSEDEVSRLDETKRIDSEYQSDVVTYLTPVSWMADFHSAPRAFDFTLGSLSNKLFLQHSRLKVAQRLLEGLDFRLTYFQQRDLDIEQTHAIIELVHAFRPWFAVSVYGEPSLYKRENDIGIAALVTPAAGHEIRFFHTWVDFTRQEHSDQPDSFVRGSEPRSLGFVGRCRGCLGFSRETGVTEAGAEIVTVSSVQQDWFEYFMRWETPTKWRFPQTESEYGYELFTGGISARLAPPRIKDLFVNLRLQASRKFEGFTPLASGSPVAAASLDRRLIESLASVELPLQGLFGLESLASFEPGLGWFHRSWRGNDDRILDHRNLLPFFWLRFDGPEKANGTKNSIALGYEVTFFDSKGDPALAADELKHWAAEHRLNFRSTFAFENQALLTFALTADPDALLRGEGGIFEGGNGQFRVFF